ncbi:hypothetical protein BS47DRAFT_1483419 [Hydnum rufescens UP504]|uniref:Transcription factor CBF/NF-Y/archaeal histone domain-containing protein n=1 Tax=Hydnum rufescens UP504 TaxID=1448309 RepID=A0A9P6B5B3_9AGAM|nr:hypothetical protein BS47DRAFT_1483419 [Hydnum rufescens UP504]
MYISTPNSPRNGHEREESLGNFSRHPNGDSDGDDERVRGTKNLDSAFPALTRSEREPMDETAPITVEPSQTYDDVPVEDDIPEEGSEHDGENAAASAPRKPKPKPPTERPPGASLLPMSRVQKIMKADKELAGTAKEAVFLISVATEEFIKRLALEGHRQSLREGRAVVMLKDLANAVRRADELLFLQEIIPHAIPASDALAKRQAKAQGDPGIIKEQGPSKGHSRGEKSRARARGEPWVLVASASNGGVRESSFAVDPEALARHYHPTYYGDEPANPSPQRVPPPPPPRRDPDSMDTS